MDSKLFKPKNCGLCPVVRIEKGSMICGCNKKLEARTSYPHEKLRMWTNCPIAWENDKGEGKDDRIH